jgi:nucleoside-diphosphate-sugar epimerase
VVEGLADVVRADLSHDAGWDDAVAGCDYVMHVASPFPVGVPKTDDEVVRPAVDGTLRVLRAAHAAGVKRVVLTSSIAAVTAGNSPGKVCTEDDWSDLAVSPAYFKSKTLAERAAWDFAHAHPEMELVVINPGMVIGPLQRASVGTSVQVVHRLLTRDLPAAPRLGFATVDVRDLAVAHVLALETPAAAGNRYICAGDHVWMRDMARMLAEEFNPRGFRVPTGALPTWLMWVIARFDPAIRQALFFVGRAEHVSADKARRQLGWTMRPVRETLVDTADSLIEHGLAGAKKKVAVG